MAEKYLYSQGSHSDMALDHVQNAHDAIFRVCCSLSFKDFILNFFPAEVFTKHSVKCKYNVPQGWNYVWKNINFIFFHRLVIKKSCFSFSVQPFPFKVAQMWPSCGQSSSGQRCGYNREEFVLVCPFRTSSGEISWIQLQMFLSVCVLGIGVWPFWSEEKKRTTGVCCTDESKFCSEQIRNPSHLRIFPSFPAECTFCDQRCGNTAAHRLDPSLSWHNVWPFGISSGNTPSVPTPTDHQPACFLPKRSFLFFLWSVISLLCLCCFTTCWILNNNRSVQLKRWI